MNRKPQGVPKRGEVVTGLQFHGDGAALGFVLSCRRNEWCPIMKRHLPEIGVEFNGGPFAVPQFLISAENIVVKRTSLAECARRIGLFKAKISIAILESKEECSSLSRSLKRY